MATKAHAVHMLTQETHYVDNYTDGLHWKCQLESDEGGILKIRQSEGETFFMICFWNSLLSIASPFITEEKILTTSCGVMLLILIRQAEDSKERVKD